MSKKESPRKRSSGDDESDEEEQMGFFESLFAPGTIDTDVSGDEYDTELENSVGSGTIYSGSEGLTEASDVSAVMRFDKELRAKHRSACKNMTVRILYLRVF